MAGGGGELVNFDLKKLKSGYSEFSGECVLKYWKSAQTQMSDFSGEFPGIVGFVVAVAGIGGFV